MFTPVVPFLDPYNTLIENDRKTSSFVKIPDNLDASQDFDDYSASDVFEYDYEY